MGPRPQRPTSRTRKALGGAMVSITAGKGVKLSAGSFGVGDGVREAVGVLLGVGVSVNVGVAVAVAVTVGVGLGVSDGRGVAVSVEVGLGGAVSLGGRVSVGGRGGGERGRGAGNAA